VKKKDLQRRARQQLSGHNARNNITKKRIHIMPSYISGTEQILPEGGPYDFVVADATEKESQGNKNPMIELQLDVKGPNGSHKIVYDNLVFTPSAFWKIDAFRICTGEVLIKGEKINFEAEDCLRRTGKLSLKIEKYEGREKNKVEEYLVPDDSEEKASLPF
jgi:hypothetical protein